MPAQAWAWHPAWETAYFIYLVLLQKSWLNVVASTASNEAGVFRSFALLEDKFEAAGIFIKGWRQKRYQPCRPHRGHSKSGNAAGAAMVLALALLRWAIPHDGVVIILKHAGGLKR